MTTGTFDMGGCFKQAFEVYKKNFGLLIGASFVASLIISLSFGILTGPILAGLMVLVLKLVNGGDGAKFSDLFDHFDSFVTTFLLCLAWGTVFYVASMVLSVLPLIGFLASIALGGAVSIFLFFAIIQVVEQKKGFQAASISAFELLKKDLWMLIACGVLGSLAASVGVIAFGIGIIITIPFYYVLIAVAYRQCTSSVSEEIILNAPAGIGTHEATAEEPVEAAEASP